MRTVEEIHTLVDEIDGFVTSGNSADARASMLHRTRCLRAWADAVEARWIASWASEHGERHSGLAALAGEIREASGTTTKEAQERTRTAKHLADHPHTAEALGAGNISRHHADVLSRAAKQSPEAAAALAKAEDELLRRAAIEPVDEFVRTVDRFVRDHSSDAGAARAVRQRARRRLSLWIEEADGMECLRADLETVPGRLVKATLLDIARELWRAHNPTGHEPTDLELTHHRSYQHVLADALVEMARRSIAPGRISGEGARGGTSVTVLIDLATLVSGLHDHSIVELADGTPIAAETARRLACEVGLIPAVLGGEGEVLDLGRSQRLADAAQRHALEIMFGGCIFGCGAPPQFVEIHHLDPWEHGGATDLINEAPLCGNHHHLVHEGGWSIRQSRLGVVEIFTPEGSLYATVRAKHPPPTHESGGAVQQPVDPLTGCVPTCS